MKVYYRMTAIPSTNPSPIYQEDKDKLNVLCLKSFVHAYSDIKPNVSFLCDFCPKSYTTMIDELCPFDHEIEYMHSGINGTALQQFFSAYQQDDDILFQECDYIYNGVVGQKMANAIKELELVSPYDHPNFYLDRTMHSEACLIKLFEDTHWRSTERDTLTFGIRNDVFKETYEIWRHYGYLDDNNWKEVRQRGHMLFVPIPGFATHMAKDWLAPSVDWEPLWTAHI